MKKYILLLATFFLFTITSQSQILISLLLGDKLNSEKLEFGLDGGFNWSKISGMDSKAYTLNFNLGFYFDMKFKNPKWSVYTGVLVKSNQGLNKLTEKDLDFLGIERQGENDDEEGDYKQVTKGFLLPGLLKYKFDNNFYLEGGIQLGWVTKAYVRYDSEVNEIETRTKQYNRDQIHKFDIGASGGLGFQFKKVSKMTLGAKYYYGFVDVYKDKPGTKNNTIFLKVNFPIGAKKKAEKQVEKEIEDIEK
jgi:opacity protein-like surface antigen